MFKDSKVFQVWSKKTLIWMMIASFLMGPYGSVGASWGPYDDEIYQGGSGRVDWMCNSREREDQELYTALRPFIVVIDSQKNVTLNPDKKLVFQKKAYALCDDLQKEIVGAVNTPWINQKSGKDLVLQLHQNAASYTEELIKTATGKAGQQIHELFNTGNKRNPLVEPKNVMIFHMEEEIKIPGTQSTQRVLQHRLFIPQTFREWALKNPGPDISADSIYVRDTEKSSALPCNGGSRAIQDTLSRILLQKNEREKKAQESSYSDAMEKKLIGQVEEKPLVLGGRWEARNGNVVVDVNRPIVNSALIKAKEDASIKTTKDIYRGSKVTQEKTPCGTQDKVTRAGIEANNAVTKAQGSIYTGIYTIKSQQRVDEEATGEIRDVPQSVRTYEKHGSGSSYTEKSVENHEGGATISAEDISIKAAQLTLNPKYKAGNTLSIDSRNGIALSGSYTDTHTHTYEKTSGFLSSSVYDHHHEKRTVDRGSMEAHRIFITNDNGHTCIGALDVKAYNGGSITNTQGRTELSVEASLERSITQDTDSNIMMNTSEVTKKVLLTYEGATFSGNPLIDNSALPPHISVPIKQPQPRNSRMLLDKDIPSILARSQTSAAALTTAQFKEKFKANLHVQALVKEYEDHLISEHNPEWIPCSDQKVYEHSVKQSLGMLPMAIIGATAAFCMGGVPAFSKMATAITGATEGAAFVAVKASLIAGASSVSSGLVVGGLEGDPFGRLNPRSILVHMVAAGFTSGCLDAAGLSKIDDAIAQNFSDQVLEGAMRTGINTAVRVSIGQENFQEAFLSELRNAGADVAQGFLASKIGDFYKAGAMGSFSHKIAHGVAGAAAGAAFGFDPLSRCVGAAVGEIVAEVMRDGKAVPYAQMDGAQRSHTQQEMKYAASLSAAVVAGLSGLDPDQAVRGANVAVENNGIIIPILLAGLAIWDLTIVLTDAYNLYKTAPTHEEGLERAAVPVVKFIVQYVVEQGVLKGGAAVMKTPVCQTFLRDLFSKAQANSWGRNVIEVGKFIDGLVDKVDAKLASVLKKLSPSPPPGQNPLTPKTQPNFSTDKPATKKDGTPYHPTYVDKQNKARIAEEAAQKTLRRSGYETMPCKMAGDRGIDGVFVKRCSKTNQVTDILIVESKYSTPGKGRLSNTSAGTQMGDRWIRDKIEKMKQCTDPKVQQTGKFLDENSSLIRRKVNEVDGSSHSRWNKIKPPPTSEFKA